jgi:Cu/Ag efflux protein CusF
MNTTSTVALALLAILLVAPAAAQQPGASGTTTMSSEPGRAKVVRTIETSAEVVAIDKETRTVTLKGPQDKPVDVVVGEEVKNFDRIKVGDMVVARYVQALALELRKTRAVGDLTEREGSSQAEPGERPGAAAVHQVHAIAEVVDVDPQAQTITLKGPLGNIVALDVRNPDQFKVVKKGDQVDVTYTRALAVSVEPAPGEKK